MEIITNYSNDTRNMISGSSYTLPSGLNQNASYKIKLSVFSNAGAFLGDYILEVNKEYYVKNGNLFLDDGTPIDMIATDDEIKILTGNYSNLATDGILEIPGTSVGFIKFDEDIPSYGKHGLQVWNHIHDRDLIAAFNLSMIPQVDRELRKIGRTIAFSRGDDQSIATVAITDEHKAFASDTRTANEYWNIELKNGYL